MKNTIKDFIASDNIIYEIRSEYLNDPEHGYVSLWIDKLLKAPYNPQQPFGMDLPPDDREKIQQLDKAVKGREQDKMNQVLKEIIKYTENTFDEYSKDK